MYHTCCFRCAHEGCTKQLTIANYRFSHADRTIYCAKHFAEREPMAVHAYLPLTTGMQTLGLFYFLFSASNDHLVSMLFNAYEDATMSRL